MARLTFLLLAVALLCATVRGQQQAELQQKPATPTTRGAAGAVKQQPPSAPRRLGGAKLQQEQNQPSKQVSGGPVHASWPARAAARAAA